MNSMNYIGKFISNFRDFYNEINTATLTGAIDVVVVEQPDGSFNCSPFHVRFGKLGVLRSREKVVDIEVNGEPLDIHMKLGESGEAFFVEELSSADLADEEIPPHLACSPIPCETFLSQHPLHEQDSEAIEAQIAANIQCKTFLAETMEGGVSQKVRRISLVSGEFRPFESDLLEAEMGVAKPMSNTQDSWTREKSEDVWNHVDKCDSPLDQNEEKWSEKPAEEVRPNVGTTGKRKRRKKSVVKKKGGSKKGGSREGHDQQPPENIFVIDDLEQPPQPEDMVAPRAPQLQLAENNFHFFSDTELSPESSPSPTQSDTEVERVRQVIDSPDEGQNWPWGELPTPPRPLADDKPANELVGVSSDVQRSMLSGMFSFMKKTKRLRRGEGVYLADIKLEELEPEVAALYFPSSYHQLQCALTPGDDDDRESGNGTSLPHSPQSVEEAIGGCKDSEADLEITKHSIFDDTAAMSLCGGLDGPGPSNEAFLHGLVTYDDLCANPKLLESPELVVQLGSKYYSWSAACSIVMSALLYQRPLPQSALKRICESPKDAKGGYASWFSWRRSVETKSTEIPNMTMKSLENGHESLTLMMENNCMNSSPGKSLDSSLNNTFGQSNAISISPMEDGPISLSEFSQRVHRKTLRLTSEQIASLNLKEGANEVMFSVTTAYQGTTRCKCHIYKWRYDDRIVISDIDGTITKSDVLGHILPIVGKDWAQSGVAQLFTKIKNNGYKLLYLSARAIGQARVTREYLRSIKQGDLSLPDGPLLLNPTSLVSAFHREVIERKPEEFKISCLRDIQALFPTDTKPFYAGYGNKVNDVWAYRAVGIPIFRIFTINHRGELKHELTQTFQSSYSNMSYIVDQMFPPSPAVEASEDFSSFVYWREPIADITVIDIRSPMKKKYSHAL